MHDEAYQVEMSPYLPCLHIPSLTVYSSNYGL